MNQFAASGRFGEKLILRHEFYFDRGTVEQAN
jgi:hypothetical protein